MSTPSHSASDRPLGFWIVLVDRLVDERFATVLEEHGVTRGQWHLLSQLRRGPVSATKLTAAAASVHATQEDLAELVDSAWVIEGDDYELTERGRGAADRLAIEVETIAGVVEGAFPPDQRDAFGRGLRRAAEHMGWEDDRES